MWTVYGALYFAIFCEYTLEPSFPVVAVTNLLVYISTSFV